MVELGYDLGEVCQEDMIDCFAVISLLLVFSLATKSKITLQLLQNLILLKKYKKKFPGEKWIPSEL